MARQYDVMRIVRREVCEAGARHGLKPHQADDIASSVDEALRREIGACDTYIPCPDKDQRNAELLEDFLQGASFAELASRYTLSEKYIRALISRLDVCA